MSVEHKLPLVDINRADDIYRTGDKLSELGPSDSEMIRKGGQEDLGM